MMFQSVTVMFAVAVAALSLPSSLGEDITCVREGIDYPQHDTCFTFHENEASWADAQQSCVDEGGFLAELDTKERDDEIQKFLKNKAGKLHHESSGFKTWIGGHASDDHTWVWSNGEKFTEAGPLKFQDEAQAHHSCAAVVMPTGESADATASEVVLSSRHCRSRLHFICEKELDKGVERKDNETQCKIGRYNGVVINDTCYVIYGNDPHNFKQNWRLAEWSCENLEGSRLTSADKLTPEELIKITGKFHGVFWLGLNRQHWIWAEDNNFAKGNTVNFTNWYRDPPVVYEVMDCMAAGEYPYHRYGWTDEKCDQKLPFVCQKETMLTTTSAEQTTVVEESETMGESLSHSGGYKGSEFTFRDWANIIVPCTMVCLVALAAIVSVVCYYRQKRKGYQQQP